MKNHDDTSWLSMYLNETQNMMHRPRFLERAELCERFERWKSSVLNNNFDGDKLLRPILIMSGTKGMSLLDAPVDIVNVYSSEFFPRYLSSHEGQALIWDCHFWDFYSFFFYFSFNLLEYSHLYKEKPKEHLQVDLEKTRKILTSMMLLFLTHRNEKDPMMSYVLAKKYKEEYPFFPDYNNGFGIKGEEDIIYQNAEELLNKFGILWHTDIAKQFIYCHEVAHQKMRTQGTEKDFAFEAVISFCELVHFLYKSDAEKIVEKHGNQSLMNDEFYFQIIEDLIDRNNDKLLEEICCDAIAIEQIYIDLTDMFDDLDKVLFALGTLSYLSMFMQWLSNTETRWKTIHKALADDHSGKIVSFSELENSLLKQNNIINSRHRLAWSYAGFVLETKYGVTGIGKYDISNNWLLPHFQSIMNDAISGPLNVSVFNEMAILEKSDITIKELVTKKNEFIGWTDLKSVGEDYLSYFWLTP